MYLQLYVNIHIYLSFSNSAITAILGTILVVSGKKIMAVDLVAKCLLIFYICCAQRTTQLNNTTELKILLGCCYNNKIIIVICTSKFSEKKCSFINLPSLFRAFSIKPAF